MLFLGPMHESCNFSNAGVDRCCMLHRQHKTKSDLAWSSPGSDLASERSCVPLSCVSEFNAFPQQLYAKSE